MGRTTLGIEFGSTRIKAAIRLHLPDGWGDGEGFRRLYGAIQDFAPVGLYGEHIAQTAESLT